MKRTGNKATILKVIPVGKIIRTMDPHIMHNKQTINIKVGRIHHHHTDNHGDQVTGEKVKNRNNIGVQIRVLKTIVHKKQRIWR